MTPDREEALTWNCWLRSTPGATLRSGIGRRLGVALGRELLLRRCVRKGSSRSPRRGQSLPVLLTPQASRESRLTAQYLSVSFDFYRQPGVVKRRYRIARPMASPVVFAGISELAKSRMPAVTISRWRSRYLCARECTHAVPRKPVCRPVSGVVVRQRMLTALEDCAALYGSLASKSRHANRHSSC